MGKGSNQRPSDVPKEQFDKNWDKIFSKDKPQTTVRCGGCGEPWVRDHRCKTK